MIRQSPLPEGLGFMRILMKSSFSLNSGDR